MSDIKIEFKFREIPKNYTPDEFDKFLLKNLPKQENVKYSNSVSYIKNQNSTIRTDYIVGKKIL